MTKHKKVKPRIDWNEKMELLKEKYSVLTDKDLDFEQGKMGEMITRVQRKVGVTKHQLYELITKS